MNLNKKNKNTNYIPLFSEEEYNSNDGLNTKCWGPPFWFTLHSISFNYPNEPTEQEKDNYHNYLMCLKNVLPCKACRENYSSNLERVGYTRECLDNRKTFSMFVYRLHNCVNKMLGKDCPLTYNQVRDRYEMFRARCVDETPVIPKHTNKKLEENTKKENGCELPNNGIKTKTIINIVPAEDNTDSFKIDPRCIPKKKYKTLK